MMKFLFALAVATLAVGADARLTARKARKLQNNQDYNYNNGNYYNANANSYYQNNYQNQGQNQNWNNGNNQNYMNQYNQNGQYQGYNNNYNNQAGQYQNGNGYNADGSNYYQQQEMEGESQDREEGEEGEEGDNADQNGYYNFQAESDGTVVDDDTFSIAHYKYLLEVHDMMEFYRLVSAILGFIIFIMSLSICWLRRQVRLANEAAAATVGPFHRMPLAPGSPYVQAQPRSNKSMSSQPRSNKSMGQPSSKKSLLASEEETSTPYCGLAA